jgi:hypothetical protein
MVLADVFAKGLVPLPTRLGITIKPQINSLVLVSDRARISRPKGRTAERVEGLETVIKVDQLWPTIERAYNERNIAALGKVVGRETVETVARNLAALHVPTNVDWAARFGLSPQPRPAPAIGTTPRSTSHGPAAAQGPAHDRVAWQRPACATCGRRVSDAVITYCQTNAARFGGAVYCMDCQQQVGRARP